jgi:DNA polymerase III epsilon subunit-like protein
MTIICVFDVETTGLLPKLSLYSTQKSQEPLPYITQLSYALYHLESRQLIKTYNEYVRVPANVLISEKVSTLTGITREKLDQSGIDINTVLESFYDAYNRSDIAVAHNIEFDGRMIELETKRHFQLQLLLDSSNLSIFADQIYNDKVRAKYRMTDIKSVCTMKTSVDLCNIEKINSRGPYIKFPSLCELYEKLFNESPKNLHNSMVDVLVCLRCYLKKDLAIDVSDEEFASYVKVAIQ